MYRFRSATWFLSSWATTEMFREIRVAENICEQTVLTINVWAIELRIVAIVVRRR